MSQLALTPLHACQTLWTLPDLRAPGAVQMAIDDELLAEATRITVRRYTWSPPAVSLGRSQRWPHAACSGRALTALPFDVVRRPSGGRAVLHGAEFEWSFAVVFPSGPEIDDAYRVVSAAMADALSAAGVSLSAAREEPYRRSALCFATSLRYDLHAGLGKVVAVAQTQRGGSTLVHGSVLERRPPDHLTRPLGELLGEPWHGEGLEGVPGIDREVVWASFKHALDRLVTE